MRSQDVLSCVLAVALASLRRRAAARTSLVRGVPCAQLEGVWDVHVDLNGLDASQRWTIAQDGCRITMTPRPLLRRVFICESATGDALESGARATCADGTGALATVDADGYAHPFARACPSMKARAGSSKSATRAAGRAGRRTVR
jgi:hypothetical protein